MQIPDERKIPTLVKNEWFYMVARVCMILALPVGSFFLHRIVAKADEISLQVAAQAIDIKLLTQRVDWELSSGKSQLNDHELRLRLIEKK